MRCQRGGLTLKTGKIGKVNCLRQQILMPGERMNISYEGSIRLESLRERDVMRINAHLATFMTPLRWLMPEWPDYVKEGSSTAKVVPQVQWKHLDTLGIGSGSPVDGQLISEFWALAYERVYNEWYKWPEMDDVSYTLLDEAGGFPAVPLAKTWSRLRHNAAPTDSLDYNAPVTDNLLDVRALKFFEARFRSGMKRDVLSFNRWMELIKDTWNGDGSREVDKVPIMLDQVSVGVNPREIPATDGASLGQWQSLFDFGVDHQIKGVVAPEHCIVTTMLTLRFASVLESKHPLASSYNWFINTADPEWVAAAQPQGVQGNQLFPAGSSEVLGYMPAGWQWRCDNDIIGEYIDVRDSFPYMLQPSTNLETKDATRVKDAFRSQALEDYLVDIFIKEDCVQPIGDTMDSYFSGMADEVQVNRGKGKGQEFPFGGKQL